MDSTEMDFMVIGRRRRACRLGLASVSGLAAGGAGALSAHSSTSPVAPPAVQGPSNAATGSVCQPLRKSAMVGDYTARDIALAAGDIVSCRFPIAGGTNGRAKARPCLVLDVWQQEDGRLCAKVACSTENVSEICLEFELLVEARADLKAAGLERPRRFFTSSPKVVPVSHQTFDANQAGKVVFGHLSRRLRRLCATMMTETAPKAHGKEVDACLPPPELKAAA